MCGIGYSFPVAWPATTVACRIPSTEEESERTTTTMTTTVKTVRKRHGLGVEAARALVMLAWYYSSVSLCVQVTSDGAACVLVRGMFARESSCWYKHANARLHTCNVCL